MASFQSEKKKSDDSWFDGSWLKSVLPAGIAPSERPNDGFLAQEAGGYGPNVSATTDPALKWTDKAKKEGEGLDGKKLPYTGGKDGHFAMDNMEVLRNLTQVDGLDETKTDEQRCAANSVLAMAIVKGGPGAVKDMVGKLDEKAVHKMYQEGKISADRYEELKKAYNEAGLAAFRVSEGIGTYGDMSKIADALKIVMSANPNGETKAREAEAMAALVGPTTDKSQLILDEEFLGQYTDKDHLKKGESWLAMVDTDVYKGGARTIDQMNHFVMMSRDPKTGKAFLYDPYPREGSQVVYEDDPAYSNYFTQHGVKGQDGSVRDLPKSSMLVSQTK